MEAKHLSQAQKIVQRIAEVRRLRSKASEPGGGGFRLGGNSNDYVHFQGVYALQAKNILLRQLGAEEAQLRIDAHRIGLQLPREDS